MSLFENDESLFDGADVYGKVAEPLLSDFKPWHKPRKQFIRDKQWLYQLKRLLKGSKYKKIDSINYFGLPGGDLLDINYIYEGMIDGEIEGNINLGFHGFINNQIDHDKAQGEISKLLHKERINKNSKIEKFNFEDLMKPNSDAWHRVKNFGAYHFINLDFCNNVMTNETLLSIYRLLDFQMKKVVGLPWLLCMTTRLNRDSATESIIKKFEVIINSFLDVVTSNEKIEKLFSEAHKHIAENTDISDIQEKQPMNQILQICLVLWILKEATSRGFKVVLKSSCKYSVNLFERDADMHSFVFRFEKNEVIQKDLLGLIPEPQKESELDINSITNKALDTLSESFDVDTVLDSDSDSLNYYADEMMELLKKCGYDVSIYKTTMTNDYGYKFV